MPAKLEPAPPAPEKTSQHSSRLLSKRAVLDRVGLSFPSVWMLMRTGHFPRSRVVGAKSFWIEAEVDAWISALPMRRYKGDAIADEAPASSSQRCNARGGPSRRTRSNRTAGRHQAKDSEQRLGRLPGDH
jgi:predicted DNA-binding transcriptional regulator AlpA